MEQYDTALMGILQNEGKCDTFLDVIFGFLMRRTDFYYIMTDEQKKLGYPKGVAAQMILEAYKKHENIFQAFQRKKQEDESLSHSMAEAELAVTPPVAQSVEVTTSASNNQVPVSQNVPQSSDTKASNSTSNNEDNSKTTSNESGPENYMSDPDCYNGAIRDNYSWSQTIKEIDFRITVPDYVTRGRDVAVEFGRKHMKVSVRNTQGQMECLLDSDLSWEVHKDDAIWTLIPEDHIIHLSLEKVQERWWELALAGEDRINTRTIDCSRPMHELDDEAQAKIHQLMFDQEQKRLGRPTSQEQGMQDMLRKAWDAEGSPFKGQPFDPSKLNVSGDGSISVNSFPGAAPGP